MIKFSSIIAGLLAGLISVLYLSQIFKWLTTKLFFIGSSLSFEGILPSVEIDYSTFNLTGYIIITLVPLLFIIITVELIIILLSKSGNDLIRTSMIIFIVTTIGYLIVIITLGVASVLLKMNFQTEFSSLVMNLRLTHNEKLIVLLMISVLLLAYLNYSAKRLKRYIPVINKIKENKDEQTTK